MGGIVHHSAVSRASKYCLSWGKKMKKTLLTQNQNFDQEFWPTHKKDNRGVLATTLLSDMSQQQPPRG
jgi:hypothetical protein